jgi:inner membrane protein
VFSSLLPDIDHAKSAVGRKLPVVSHTISAVFGHRRLFHGLFGCAISCAVIYFICQVFAVGAWKLIVFAVAFGYVAHLVADSATIQGIRWFYPVKWFHTKGPIETGSINEWIFMGIMLFLIGVLAGDIGFSVLHFV